MTREQNIALFGGSFNPPGNHHRRVAEALAPHFDQRIVIPCGKRPDRPEGALVTPEERSAMCEIAFKDIPNVALDLFDVRNDPYTRAWKLEERFRAMGRPWHIIGADLATGGARGTSQIQTTWEKGEELWLNASFAVVTRPGIYLSPADMPPHSRLFEISAPGSSSRIREALSRGESIIDRVPTEVARYISDHRLYERR